MHLFSILLAKNNINMVNYTVYSYKDLPVSNNQNVFCHEFVDDDLRFFPTGL